MTDDHVADRLDHARALADQKPEAAQRNEPEAARRGTNDEEPEALRIVRAI